MCGISGIFSPTDVIPDAARAELKAATARMRHRGPDEQGAINLPNFCAAHNRLSIIDLSTGQQPMVDAETGNVIVFNGEIYNYVELRLELKQRGLQFSTESDTEVLLKCYAHFGIEMLSRLNGMFAFAIFDAQRQELLLARDRFGEKPLYFFTANDCCYFASELSGLAEFRDCGRQLSAAAVMEYFAAGYVSGPDSLLKGVQQLLPGSWLRIGRAGTLSGRYYVRSCDGSTQLSDEQIHASLTEAIRMRLRADVPVATLLSGGIDSSLITLIAQRSSSQKLHSFAFGWNGEEDELPYARIVAELAGTIHHEIKLDRMGFAKDITNVVRFMDMPQADSAAFVVYQLAKGIAENGVKVVLSGDGGDELFGGYDWYKGTTGPKPIARRLLRGKHSTARDYVLGKASFSLADLNGAFGEEATRAYLERRTADYLQHSDSVNGRIGFDYQYFLPWMLMPKVDRMSMAHAVEVRAPLLDHMLVDQWAGLSGEQKVSREQTKVRIKQFCIDAGLLSAEFLNRKKMGMNLPLSWWIRTNSTTFKEVVLQNRAQAIELFGRSSTESWFADVAKETTPGWTRSAQKIWSAYIFELWRQRLLD